MSSETATPVGAAVRGRFPPRMRVEAAGPGRHTLTDPRTRAQWALGAAELAVARRFDGRTTYTAIAEDLHRVGGRRISPDKLRAFEARLLGLGVLEDATRPRLAQRLARLERVDFGAVDPTPALDAVLRRAPWLVRGPAVAAMVAGVAAALAGLLARLPEFAAAVPSALRGWGLLWMVVVITASSVFHEGGHALACRAFGVPVREVGIGLRSLVVFAWTEPDQRRWAALGRGPRLVTVAAGPLGSLVFGSLGAALWLAPLPEPARTAGVFMALAGTVCMVPTLLPVFDGDAYLLLTGLPGCANLRSRSFAHVRGLFTGARSTEPAGVRAGYLAFAAITVLGRLAVAGFALWTVWVCLT